MANRTIVPFGPQHPVLPEPIHLDLVLEDEKVVEAIPSIGFVHRGLEELAGRRDFHDYQYVVERICGICSFKHGMAYCETLEQIFGAEVPPRAKYLRTIWGEMSRIHSHLLWLGLLADAFGFDALFMQCWRMREKVLDMFEASTGGRVIFSVNTIGGVQADIHPDFVRKVKEFIAYMRPVLREYHEIFTGNVIAQERLKGTGVLTREDAISFGATGGTGRAAGWACDVRKRHPYAVYGKVDFEEVLFTEGDCLARYMVRMREIEQSMNIVEQLIDNIPEGEYQLKMKPVIRIPEGSYYAAVEGSRGEFGVFIESRGDKSPYRMKFRSTGLPLVSCLETIAKGTKIADLIAIGGTLDYVVPDIDR